MDGLTINGVRTGFTGMSTRSRRRVGRWLERREDAAPTRPREFGTWCERPQMQSERKREKDEEREKKRQPRSKDPGRVSSM